MSLPKFKYHPDPIKTGSVIPSENICECCEKQRGYIYTGPVYAVEEYSDCICPWCIADGSAAEKFDATFMDDCELQNEAIDESIIEEIVTRTIGFSGWQQERWCVCCNDAAAFLGVMGQQELIMYGEQAIATIQDETGLEGSDWENYFKHLNKKFGPTAYLFQCLHCHGFVGYSDCT